MSKQSLNSKQMCSRLYAFLLVPAQLHEAKRIKGGMSTNAPIWFRQKLNRRGNGSASEGRQKNVRDHIHRGLQRWIGAFTQGGTPHHRSPIAPAGNGSFCKEPKRHPNEKCSLQFQGTNRHPCAHAVPRAQQRQEGRCSGHRNAGAHLRTENPRFAAPHTTRSQRNIG
jgi:hypothetical protein